MYVNFKDTVVYGRTPTSILEKCKALRPALADSLTLVEREPPRGPDVYRMRGASHTGWVVFDGEVYMHIWND